jgi:hypothetical protein
MDVENVHRRSDMFESNADNFNPHRYDNNWEPDTWTFFPFN